MIRGFYRIVSFAKRDMLTLFGSFPHPSLRIPMVPRQFGVARLVAVKLRHRLEKESKSSTVCKTWTGGHLPPSGTHGQNSTAKDRNSRVRSVTVQRIC
jgi:hypothetical protein